MAMADLIAKRPGRTILAFWLAPLVVPVLLWASGQFTAGATFPGFGELAAEIVAIAIFALPVSYAGLVVFGVPTLILLERFGRLSLLSLVACAAVEGFIVPYLVLAAFGEPFQFWGGYALLWLLLDGSIPAAGVAVAFWYIAGLSPAIKKKRRD